MTPNKLPPLPFTQFGMPPAIKGFSPEPLFTSDQMHAYAAEAIRQSQSLPAGAVAGLVGKWREEAGFPCGPFTTQALNQCADELEQAFQADAREKGEAASGKVNGYLFSQRAIEVIVDGEIPEWMSRQPGIRVKLTPEGATQPAQASEKDGPGEEDGPWAEGWSERSRATHPQPVTPAGGEVEDEAIRLYALNSHGWKNAPHWLELHEQTRELWQAFALRRLTHPPAADAALVRDAERYRWLRENCTVDGPGFTYWHDSPECTPLDERVDAALNQRGGGDER